MHSGEMHVPIIDALANDNPGIFSVNVLNNGSIAGIPDDVVVEGKALVNGAGIQLLSAGTLPHRLMVEILWPRWVEMERDLSAFLSGDRDLLREIVLRDHRTTRTSRRRQHSTQCSPLRAFAPWRSTLRTMH